jgi:hypothetical protein
MTTMAYPMRVARTAKPYRLASRITADCRNIIDQAMRRSGLNEAGVIELAVREYAERRNIVASMTTETKADYQTDRPQDTKEG